MNSDPIADMLTRIRNALMAQHSSVEIPHSNQKVGIAQIMKNEGYIEDYSVSEEGKFKTLVVELKYWGPRRERRPVITKLQRISKPGRRIYVGKDDIPWVLSGMGISIMTTPQGIMTGQEARRLGIGGEVLCYIW